MLLNQEHLSIIRENSRDEAAYRRIMAVFDSLARDPEADRLRQAFENSPNPLFAVGRDGRIVGCNAACASLFDRQPTGQSYQDLLWAKNGALQRQVEAVFEGQSFDNVPITYRGARGQARFMVSRLYPVWDADGTVRECVFANTDITERKRREDALRRRERFIQRLLETSPALVYIYDLQEERSVYINRQVGHILGYTPEDIQAMGSEITPRLIHPDDQPRLLAARCVLAQASERETVEFEFRIKKADGSWRWLYSRESVFMRYPDGSPRQTLGTAVDITERKQAEAAQRQQEAFFSTVVETAQEGIWIVDAALRTLYVNRRLADMLGFSPSEMLDQNLLEFLDQSGMGLTAEQRETLCQAVVTDGSARYD
ncbi:PAS domain S-box protein, partial [Anaerolineae bacterium CFX8]|nr:PAS domain S-box protein [Anaerolineae bacterium CFX8]